MKREAIFLLCLLIHLFPSSDSLVVAHNSKESADSSSVYELTARDSDQHQINVVEQTYDNNPDGLVPVFGGSDVNVVNQTQSTHTINSTLYKSVKRFYCSLDNFNDAYLLVYGTKSWTFPRQDINLTLSYPSANNAYDSEADADRYLITSLEVVLYIDGTETRGYITSGGILQSSMRLAFIVSNVTTLSYEFRVHGKHNQEIPGEELERYSYKLC